MKKFKSFWQIDKNWQLVFPLLGILLSIISAYRISIKVFVTKNTLLTYLITGCLALLIVKLCVWIIKKLENKWIVNQKWELIRIFIVFAITGSSSVFLGRPFIKWIGLHPDKFNPILYWFLFVIISLFLYQIILLALGWISGQFNFFWEFEKRFLKRMGLGKITHKL